MTSKDRNKSLYAVNLVLNIIPQYIFAFNIGMLHESESMVGVS